MLVKDDHSKFIYSIDVNKSVEYFCESAPMVSDRSALPLLQSRLHSLRLLLWVMVQRLISE